VVLEAVARQRRHVTLAVVGAGPEEPALRAQARALGLDGRVEWAGPLDHPAVRLRYRQSDLFVLAPRVARSGDRDGLPNVVVEALSQGLPVVATRAAALAEVVEDGTNGRLVPPDDPAALADALESLVADPAARRRMGASGIRTVAEGWDVEATADRLVELLDPLLGRMPVPSAA
jgi:glycosyltransferase involved in cell wall biosynthesis